MALHPERANLRITLLMPLPHELPLFCAMAFHSHSSHDGARLLWKVWRGAREHHRFNALRLLRRHVQKGFAAGAHANRFASTNAQMVEQAKHIERRLPKGKLA